MTNTACIKHSIHIQVHCNVSVMYNRIHYYYFNYKCFSSSFFKNERLFLSHIVFFHIKIFLDNCKRFKHTVKKTIPALKKILHIKLRFFLIDN